MKVIKVRCVQIPFNILTLKINSLSNIKTILKGIEILSSSTLISHSRMPRSNRDWMSGLDAGCWLLVASYVETVQHLLQANTRHKLTITDTQIHSSMLHWAAQRCYTTRPCYSFHYVFKLLRSRTLTYHRFIREKHVTYIFNLNQVKIKYTNCWAV